MADYKRLGPAPILQNQAPGNFENTHSAMAVDKAHCQSLIRNEVTIDKPLALCAVLEHKLG
jgi:hypothetical protein